MRLSIRRRMKKLIVIILPIVLFCSCVALCGLIPDPAQSESATPTPFQPEFPTFGPAIEWPNSLDQAWQFIEEGRNGYTFTACLPGEPTQPFITWQMANDAVGAQTESRKHPYLEIWADDVARIVAPGGGIFPTEHRIVREHEIDFLGINGTPCDEATGRVDRIYGFIGLLNRQYDGRE